MNNKKQLFQNWDQTKNRLRKQYTSLSEEDVKLEQGREDELIERLQSKLGKKRDEVERMLEDTAA